MKAAASIGWLVSELEKRSEEIGLNTENGGDYRRPLSLSSSAEELDILESSNKECVAKIMNNALNADLTRPPSKADAITYLEIIRDAAAHAKNTYLFELREYGQIQSSYWQQSDVAKLMYHSYDSVDLIATIMLENPGEITSQQREKAKQLRLRLQAAKEEPKSRFNQWAGLMFF